jgi:sarcosine oxidase subunit alpha
MPLCDLLWLVGAEFVVLESLGGFVPVVDGCLQSSVPNVFVAGDAAGIEEASIAMEQGRIAGLSAARAAGHPALRLDDIESEARNNILELRSGPDASETRAAYIEMEHAARGEAASWIVQQSLAGC